MIIIYLSLLIITLTLLLWQISNLVSVFYGSPWIKTNQKVIAQALKLAQLEKGDIFCDLGCGGGDVLIEANKYGVRSIGYEISPFYFLLAKQKIFWGNYKNIKIKMANILEVDLAKVDVYYCYLLPGLLNKLAPKFKEELSKGAKLISISFPIDKFKPYLKSKFQNHTIYVYKF